MANVAFLNAYQINQSVLPRDSPQKVGFATASFGLMFDVSGSSDRSLSSGYNVYSLIVSSTNGKWYYVAETVAQLATIFG